MSTRTSNVDPSHSVPVQPDSRQQLTYLPGQTSSTPFLTSPLHESIEGTRQPDSMSYGLDDPRASAYHRGPVRTARRQRMSSHERHRRTFRDHSRSRRTTPYGTSRGRSERPIDTFEDVNAHRMTGRGPSESHDPTGAHNENIEAERFLSRADVRQSISEQRLDQPAFGRSTSASQQLPSSQPSFHQATPQWTPPHQSSFDTMIDRMVVMLAEENIHTTHEQVREMVLRLQQRSASLAPVNMGEDTAESNEGRQPRWFH